jgi:hypothetical protein
MTEGFFFSSPPYVVCDGNDRGILLLPPHTHNDGGVLLFSPLHTSGNEE